MATLENTPATSRGSKVQPPHDRASFLILRTALLISIIGLLCLAYLLGASAFLNFGVLRIDERTTWPIAASGLFLSGMLAFAVRIAVLNRRPPPQFRPPAVISEDQRAGDRGPLLNVNDLLAAEYTSVTDAVRGAINGESSAITVHTAVFGVALSAVLALVTTAVHNPLMFVGAAVLLWVVCIVGWVTLLRLIALRMGYVVSLNAMNYIKEFYLTNEDATHVPRQALASAFFFSSSVLPMPSRHWTGTHLNMISVAVLDALAFCFGSILLALFAGGGLSVPVIVAALLGSGLCFVAHAWIWDIALTYRPVPQRAQ